MKRRRLLITGVLLLLIGAIVNVAVAWGDRIHGANDRFVAALLSVSSGGITPMTERKWEASGWPCDSLELDVTSYYHAVWRGERFSWNGGIRIDQPRWLIGRLRDGLPTRPIWPGFAINTIFYAAMLWVVWFVPGMVRRRIRRRRGLCPACAYPIGTSPVCTECGKALA